MTKAIVAGLLSLSLLGGCTPPGDQPHQRLRTEHFMISVWMDPVPPVALEQIAFRVVVSDKETGEPIEGGAGRIFATNEDQKSIYNGFEKGPEPGTYHTKLMFVTAGPWAIGIQFQRDSTSVLERVNDWMQQVYPEVPAGQEKK